MFTTRDLPPADQFAAWEAFIAPLVDVRLPDNASPEGGFRVDHTAWNLGSILVVRQSTPAYSYARSDAKLRSSPIDHWYLAIPHSGQTWTEVDGEVAAGRPGKAELRSLAHPFRGRTTESESLHVYFPRDLFNKSAAVLDAKNNAVLSGNAADLLVDYVNGIEQRLQNLAAEDLPRIVQSTRDMLIACLASTNEDNPTSDQMTNIALMERARRYVQGNLNTPELTPEAMCRALGVSRTRLYQLFEPSGGVSHYIQKRRLLMAHAALSDPTDGRRIVEIAEAVGFTSAANFSRAFSHEFGYSPREARSAMHRPELAGGSSAGHDAKASFEGWLRALGS